MTRVDVTLRGNKPFVSSVHSSGRYFLDQYGSPLLWRSNTFWDLINNAGKYGEAATPAGVFETVAAHLESKNFNACTVQAISTNLGGDLGPAATGATWDGVLPFVSGNIGSLNDSYWSRVDSFVDACAAHGLTACITLVTSYNIATGGPFNGMTNTTAGNYGTAIGNRYKNRPNIVWQFGVDYFADVDAQLNALMAALRATGDTHLCTIEYNAECTSRKDSTGANPGSFTYTDFDDIYAYQAAYQMCEVAYSTTPAKPALNMDGHYDGGGSGNTEQKLMGDLLGWTLTSGSCGYQYGSQSTWAWASTAPAGLTSDAWVNNDMPAVMDKVASFSGWQNLVPDFSSTFITSARGTRLGQLTSGGNGGQYDGSTQNNYLTGAVTADGKLGLIYTPVARTFTIDTTKLGAGFTAHWMDPTTGTLTSATAGSSYTTPGNNAAGLANWYLVLQA